MLKFCYYDYYNYCLHWKLSAINVNWAIMKIFVVGLPQNGNGNVLKCSTRGRAYVEWEAEPNIKKHGVNEESEHSKNHDILFLWSTHAWDAYSYIASWVGTNSGMDYWNGTLDWTTGLCYFPFLDKFLFYLATVGDCSNESIVI